MVWIRNLNLLNWMPYKGKTSLQFDAKPYSIVARRTGNAESSNWCGKSALPEAVYFALTGKLNPDRHMGADGWITDGEKEGHVQLVLSTGDVITRSRKLGKSTQLRFNEAKGDEAQALIYDLIGTTADDLLVTCIFQQRQMSRLVLAQSAQRMAYVSAWLQLGALEKAEENLSNELAQHSWQSETLKQRLEQLKAIELQELGNADFDTLTNQLVGIGKSLGDAASRHMRLQTLLEKNRNYADAPSIIVEFEEMEAEVKKIDQTKDVYNKAHHEKAVEAYDQARESRAIAIRVLDQANVLVRGEFDGHCPIAKIDCPATNQINGQRAKNKESFKQAEDQVLAITESLNGFRIAKEKWEALHAERIVRNDRRETLQTRIARDTKKYEEAKRAPPAMDFEELRAKVQDAYREVSDLTAKKVGIQRSLSVIEHTRREALNINHELSVYAKRIETWREALHIFGKQGAQRRVAEDALAQFQDDANEMLAECGINLEVDVSWSREGGDLAKTCDTCGHPFPKSAKVKTCEKCQSPRGLNLINKLDIILSEQSGAAEDLVGCAIQLAASSWLRENRGVLWSSALIDEPFSFCDKANRRSLATYLSRMLTRPGGFEQAFVISHTSDTDAFPGLIEITNDGKFSTARVVT
jgi:DNA repair exonuclease SbcCD ATPase subunit